MTAVAGYPTSYLDVNAALQRFLSGVRAILGPHFVGMYLDGSLAIGDFEPEKSDIDFLVVTDQDLFGEILQALKAMHVRLMSDEPKWGKELEGSYIPIQALRRHDPGQARHPYIDRGSGSLNIEQHDRDWVIHRHVLREYGVALAGPELKALIDPVPPGELRQAVLDVLHGWWVPMLTEPTRLQNMYYRCYANLTMCRMLYTLRHGTVVSKPIAARWAQETLDPRWTSLIQDSLAWSRQSPPDLSETLDFIRYTRDRREQLGAP